MDAALKLERVCKRYGDFEAVRELSFEVPYGASAASSAPTAPARPRPSA